MRGIERQGVTNDSGLTELTNTSALLMTFESVVFPFAYRVSSFNSDASSVGSDGKTRSSCCVKGCVDAIDATFSTDDTPVDILVRRFSGEGSFMIAARVKTR